MNEALSDARDESNRHADRCMAAQTMPEITKELDRHELVMQDVTARMDSAMSSMHDGMSCSSAGMDGMMQTVSDVKTAVSAHQDQMTSETDTASAHTECSRYRDDMVTLCSEGFQRTNHMGCM